MADQIPDSTKMDAVDILKTYADFIRNDVRADDFERHPYLPHIEQTIEDLRAAPPAMDREAVACPTCGDTSPLEECATCGAYPTRTTALSTLSADAIRQGEGERGFCNKCGFVGVPQKGGFHYRPKDGQPCNYICPVSATPASHASDGGKA